MWPIVTDKVAWSVCRSVCLSVCHTSEPAKTAKPIEMPFRLRTLVGPGNHVLALDGVQIHHGKGYPIVKHRDTQQSYMQQRLNWSRCYLGYGLGCAQGIILVGGPQVVRDAAMATSFWLSMGYNFGCMIASDTLFDSRDGFSRSSYPMKT